MSVGGMVKDRSDRRGITRPATSETKWRGVKAGDTGQIAGTVVLTRGRVRPPLFSMQREAGTAAALGGFGPQLPIPLPCLVSVRLLEGSPRMQ